MARLEKYKTAANPLPRICQALAEGLELAAAARIGGVGVDTLLRWESDDADVRAQLDAARAAARDAGVSAATRPAKAPTPKVANRWDQVREDAAKLGPGLFGLYLWVDALLVGKGFPPTSRWWLWILGVFWASGLRWLVLLVGRGGGKSSTLARIAVVIALFCERKIPPGQTWLAPFVSVLKSDARRRLEEIEAILGALGVETKRSSPEGIPTLSCEDAAGNSIAFVSIAATVAGVSGPSALLFVGDEVAKWRDEDTGANPAEQVVKSARQMFRARPQVFGFLSSSAWGTSGVHHEMVDEGTGPLQMVASLGPIGLALALAGFERAAVLEEVGGRPDLAAKIREYAATLDESSTAIPTFVANETITPELSRAEEPDLSTWLREVASVPTGADDEHPFFDLDSLARAASLRFVGEGVCSAAIDPASRKNAAALAIVRRVETEDGPRFVPVLLRQWLPIPGSPLDLRRAVLPEMARLCAEHGCIEWTTDVHALTDVEIVGAAHGLVTRCRAEGNVYEAEARPVRDGVHRGVAALSGCEGAPELVEQLRAMRTRLVSGRLSVVFAEEGDLHSDLARAYVSAAAAAGCGKVEAASWGFSGLPGRYSGADPRTGRYAGRLRA